MAGILAEYDGMADFAAAGVPVRRTAARRRGLTAALRLSFGIHAVSDSRPLFRYPLTCPKDLDSSRPPGG